VTEIWSGKSMNDILTDLQLLPDNFPQGPHIRLDQSKVAHLNVTSGRSEGNVGALTHGKLAWPWALQRRFFRANREKLATLFSCAAAAAGSLDPDKVDDIDATLSALYAQLKARIRVLPSNEYVRAKRFLNHCEDALRALKQPDAADYFNGKNVARGQTVAELVGYMTTQGLRFAPAVAGGEAAYLCVHRALAQYSLAVHRPPAGASLCGPQCTSPQVSNAHLKKRSSPSLLPAFQRILPSGRNAVVIRNPNPYSVTAGLRSGAAGVDLLIPAQGFATIFVPDGRYDLYLCFSERPYALYQGDTFTLLGKHIEIRLVQLSGGNYGIRRLK
jgi:hypothetical protein